MKILSRLSRVDPDRVPVFLAQLAERLRAGGKRLSACFELIEAQPVSPVLLDLSLPGQHGLEALAELPGATRAAVVVLRRRTSARA